MNDDRLLLEMRRWLQEERVALPDAEEAGQQIASRLPTTRQRRRKWWRMPRLARASKPPTTRDTTDYQPKPIPATNGHTPSVNGRTQSMLSPVKAIGAGAVIFAIGGAFLIAQPFQQQSSMPGAASDSELMHPAPVSGSFTAFGSDHPLRITVDASDPRLQVTGIYKAAESFQGSDDSEADLSGVLFSTWELANDEGGWIGTGAEIDLDYDATVLELDGLGAYDGLTASLLMQWRESGFSFVGAIVPSELFPAPEATATQ